MRRGLSLFLINLLFFASLVTAFHHHEDGAAHLDCPICVTGQHQPAAPCDAPASVLAREFTTSTVLLPNLLTPASHGFSPAQGRAPPS